MATPIAVRDPPAAPLPAPTVDDEKELVISRKFEVPFAALGSQKLFSRPRVPKPNSGITAVAGQKVAGMIEGNVAGTVPLRDLMHSPARDIPDIKTVVVGAFDGEEDTGGRHESAIAAPGKMERRC